ncbi:MAG: hypothetical protein ACP5PC_04870 [bacterium]
MINLKSQKCLRLFDPNNGITVANPPDRGIGFWAGASSILYDEEDKKFYLYYRLRRPRLIENGKEIGRGYECRIAESEDGINFRTIWRTDKSYFGGISLEKASLIKTLEGNYRLYISYVDPEDNRWRIDMLEADKIENLDPTKKTKIFTPSDLGIEGIKDPEVIILGGLYYMFVSYAPSPKGIDPILRSKMHETADVYNTGISKSCTGLAVSADGINFKWLGDLLSPRENSWDAYATRITSIVYSSPIFYAFYDGSRDVSENYEEKLGLAVSLNLKDFEIVSVNGPILLSPYSSGSVRYVSVVPVLSRLYYYYEMAVSDGSHELRVSVVES